MKAPEILVIALVVLVLCFGVAYAAQQQERQRAEVRFRVCAADVLDAETEELQTEHWIRDLDADAEDLKRVIAECAPGADR